MTPGSFGSRAGDPMPDPSEAEMTELARLSKRFRRHRIFREVTRDRGTRYMAYRTAPGAQPHTIITDDLGELRDELVNAVAQELLAGLPPVAENAGSAVALTAIRAP